MLATFTAMHDFKLSMPDLSGRVPGSGRAGTVQPTASQAERQASMGLIRLSAQVRAGASRVRTVTIFISIRIFILISFASAHSVWPQRVELRWRQCGGLTDSVLDLLQNETAFVPGAKKKTPEGHNIPQGLGLKSLSVCGRRLRKLVYFHQNRGEFTHLFLCNDFHSNHHFEIDACMSPLNTPRINLDGQRPVDPRIIIPCFFK